jgi:hypothetical protein
MPRKKIHNDILKLNLLTQIKKIPLDLIEIENIQDRLHDSNLKMSEPALLHLLRELILSGRIEGIMDEGKLCYRIRR